MGNSEEKFTDMYFHNQLKDVEVKKLEECIGKAISELIGIEYQISITSIEFSKDLLPRNNEKMSLELKRKL